MNTTDDNSVKLGNDGSAAAGDNLQFDKTEYDHLNKKPTQPNEPASELKSLQERLEAYKKDPTGTPWESAFEKLLKEESGSGSDVC